MKRTSALCIILFFLVCAFTQGSVAEESSAKQVESVGDKVRAKSSGRERAMALMEQSRFEEAYNLLAEFHQADPNDIQGQFVLGMAALELGKVDEAIKHFEAILEKNPELPRVRLELARAYTAKGNKKDARDEFKKVLETNPPEQVRDNIKQFLVAIEEDKKLHIRASIGYLYDDNVNAGPDTGTVSFFGLPFALEPGAKQQSDSALVESVTMDHRFPLSKDVDLMSTFGFRGVSYSSWSEFNTEEFVVTSGPSFRGERTLTRIPFIFDYTRLGSDRYGVGYGIRPELRYALTKDLSLNVSWLGEKKQYFSRVDRTGYLWAIDSYARKLLNKNTFLDIGYRHFREETKKSFLDNDTDTVYAGIFTKLSNDTSLFVGPSLSWTTYDEREAAFEHARDDLRTKINVNLLKELGDGLEIAVGYTYTYNDSNLELYGFRRNQLTIQISKSF